MNRLTLSAAHVSAARRASSVFHQTAMLVLKWLRGAGAVGRGAELASPGGAGRVRRLAAPGSRANLATARRLWWALERRADRR